MGNAESEKGVDGWWLIVGTIFCLLMKIAIMNSSIIPKFRNPEISKYPYSLYKSGLIISAERRNGYTIFFSGGGMDKFQFPLIIGYHKAHMANKFFCAVGTGK